MKKTALLILHENVEELEAIAVLDVLRRGGVELTTASREESLTVSTKQKAILTADISLDEALKNSYDCIILPGGPGVMQLKEDARVLKAVQDYTKAGKLVAAICAAPLVLDNAGVLQGKKYTAHFSVDEMLPNIDCSQDVVEDGKLITSQGPGTAVAFAFAILKRLQGEETAEKIQEEICLY